MYSWWIAFMHNVDMLEKGGLPGPSEDWAALRSYASKLTQDNDGDGRNEQWGTKMYAYSRSENQQVLIAPDAVDIFPLLEYSFPEEQKDIAPNETLALR